MKRLVATALVLALALTGCAHSGPKSSPSVTVASEAFDIFSGDYENTPAIKKSVPRSVAVLPMHGDPARWSGVMDGEAPTAIVRKGLYNHLSSLPFSDLELSEVDTRLKNAGLGDWPAIEKALKEDPEKLKSVLGVDAVLAGEVTHFDRVFAGVVSQVAVGCKVRLLSLDDGELLWRAEHVSRSVGGGFSLNPIGLAMNAVAALWNMRSVELLRQTDDLFREMVGTIYLPESLRAARIVPPRIDLFAPAGHDGPYRAGERVVLLMVGDPGCTAYADLGAYKSALPMTPASNEVKAGLQNKLSEKLKAQLAEAGVETTPELMAQVRAQLARREIYQAEYVVQPGEEVSGLLAQGSLVAQNGGKAVRVAPGQPLDIDAKPPKAPVGVRAEALDGKVRVSWGGNRENDLAGFEIHTSDTALTGFTKTAQAESGGRVLDGLPNFKTVFIKVAALDKAGNRSEFSRTVKAVPAPVAGLTGIHAPGPDLGGEISSRTILKKDKGPFTVRTDLIVASGGELFIEPGTVVHFSPGTGLIVSGGDLLAFGTPDAPITLGPAAAHAQPGSWKGVSLTKARRAELASVRIIGAATGLSVSDCAPQARQLAVTGSSQAGLHFTTGAKPVLTGCLVSGNQGMGGLLMEGTGLAPRVTDTIFENNTPFDVQSFAPVEIDMSGNWFAADPAQSVLGGVRTDPALDSRPDSVPNP